MRRHIKLAEAASFGQTIFEYAPGLAGAEDYSALADAVLDAWRTRDQPRPEIVTRPVTPPPARADA